MRIGLRAARLAGASTVALAAAGALGSIYATPAAACTATPVLLGGIVSSVRVDCVAGDQSDNFLTSYDADIETYDGNGDDVLNLTGGTIGDAFTVPPRIGVGGLTLDPSDIVTETLGGDDFVSLTASVGAPAGVTMQNGLQLGAGNDRFEMSAGSIGGSVLGDDAVSVGNDAFIISGGAIGGSLFAGGGVDEVTISGGTIGVAAGGFDSVALEDGDDILTMTGGTLAGAMSAGAGNDQMQITGGSVGTFVDGGTGNNSLVLGGTATIGAQVTMEGGDDQVTINGGIVGTFVNLGGGANAFVMNGGTVNQFVLGGADADTVDVFGGSIGGGIFVGDGTDAITIAGGSVSGNVEGGDGDDSIEMSSGTVGGSVLGGAGEDLVTLSGATVSGNLEGGDDEDVVEVSAGTVNGSVLGGAGEDLVTVSGGTIFGDINAESVTLLGGDVAGDITGLTGNTLTINATTLSLRDGVLFQGTNAVGSVTGTDLAASGSQNFDGFSSFVMNSGSTMRFAGGTQQISNLFVQSGSTLFTTGTGGLAYPGGAPGNLTLTNASINMINGVAGDVFNVSDFAMNNGTLAIDVNAQNGVADLVNAAGSFTAAGANTVFVNLVGPLDLNSPSVVAIAPVAGETAPVDGVASPLFTVAGAAATPGALFNYTVITGSDGGLYLLAVPTEIAAPTATRAALDSSPIDNVTASIYDILGDAVLTNFGLLSGGNRPDGAPNFGIYASGQYARVSHDGFDVTNGFASGVGPSFNSDDFSLAASVEFNAAQYFGFDQTYGLDIGMFGGYASSDVTMDPTTLFPDIGDGQNRSGMIGGYGLFRSGTSYGMVSATGFFGNTDINNYVLNSTGTYDTAGGAVTGTVGHVFALGDTWRFDLRGGVLGVYFQGDAFTDSQGNNFGKSRISFGAVKFEPGFYAQYALENGKILSPYLRTEFQQRIGYRNTSTVEDVEFEFDDADFSASVSAGANYKFTDVWTASAEMRGKFSADSNTLAGKVGLKARF